MVCEQICRSDKINAEAWLLLGMANKGLGLAAEALPALERAAMLNPGDAFTQNEKGMLLAQLGRYQEAIAAFRLALSAAQEPATLHVNIGVAYGFMRQYPAALEALDHAVQSNPESPGAHLQRSAVLSMLGRHEDAILAAERALALNRYGLGENVRFGEALIDAGRFDEALAAYGVTLSIAPDYLPAQQRVVELSHKATVDGSSNAHFKLLQRIFTWRQVDFRDITAYAASIFKARAGFLDTLQTVPSGGSQSVEEGMTALSALVSEHRFYFDNLLTRTVLDDPLLELATSEFRGRVLSFLWAHRNEFDAGIPATLELLLSGLSRQCFTNEYVWASTQSEADLVEALHVEVEQAWRAFPGGTISPDLALRTWMISLYRPLYAVLPSQQPELVLSGSASPLLKQMLTLQYAEYWQEQQIKAGIKSLTPISAGISAEVKQQYEENPYPRWQFMPTIEPATPAATLGKLFPDGNLPAFLDQPIEMLIAGCGTGRHSILTARQFPGAHITAIDLSLASLAYATRKSRELGATNVDYYQADITALDQLDKQFQIVESIGVLHHLADPLAGWRNLTALVAPGGLMRIALYSQIARAKLNPARELIKQKGIGNDAAAIRAFRQQVLREPEGTELANIARLGPDFYSLSNCRDLLFHVQEHQFTLLQIASMLDELGLKFLAMESDPWSMQQYARFNPTDNCATDLEGWHRFELEHPLTFAGMYQFWCQRC